MPVSSKQAEDIQFKCRNKCCICNKEGIQIHHIDGNHNNDKEDNLAPLCHEHHELAQISLEIRNKMTKKLTPSLVKRFRDQCYEKNKVEFEPASNWVNSFNEVRQEIVSLKEMIEKVGGDKK